MSIDRETAGEVATSAPSTTEDRDTSKVAENVRRQSGKTLPSRGGNDRKVNANACRWPSCHTSCKFTGPSSLRPLLTSI